MTDLGLSVEISNLAKWYKFSCVGNSPLKRAVGDSVNTISFAFGIFSIR